MSLLTVFIAVFLSFCVAMIANALMIDVYHAGIERQHDEIDALKERISILETHAHRVYLACERLLETAEVLAESGTFEVQAYAMRKLDEALEESTDS